MVSYFEHCVSKALMFQEEEPCESSSGAESGAEDHPSLTSVVDVEDLGKIMSHVKKEKVLYFWEVVNLDPAVG